MGVNYGLEVSVSPMLSLYGDVDVYTYVKLNDAFKSVLENYPDAKNISIDLTGVGYVDSTGLGTLAMFAAELDKNKGNVVIVGATESVKRIFNVSGLVTMNFIIK